MLIPGFIRLCLLFSLQCSPGCCTEVFIAHDPSGFRQNGLLRLFLPILVRCLRCPAVTPLLLLVYVAVDHVTAPSAWSCLFHALQPQSPAAGLPQKEGSLGTWKRGTNFFCSQITLGSSSKDPGYLLHGLVHWQLPLSVPWGSSGMLQLCIAWCNVSWGREKGFSDRLKVPFLLSHHLAPSTKYKSITWQSAEVHYVRKKGTRRILFWPWQAAHLAPEMCDFGSSFVLNKY